MSFLDRQPTMADVIAWVLGVPAIILGLVVCPTMLRVLGHFEPMFASVGAKLPGITLFILGNGWWYFTLLPLAILVGMVWVLLACRHGLAKVITAFVAGQAVLLIAGSAVIGVFYPILELQKQLR